MTNGEKPLFYGTYLDELGPANMADLEFGDRCSTN